MTDPDTSESQTTVTAHKHRHPKQEQEPASEEVTEVCLLYTSPSPRDRQKSRMPSSA